MLTWDIDIGTIILLRWNYYTSSLVALLVVVVIVTFALTYMQHM